MFSMFTENTKTLIYRSLHPSDRSGARWSAGLTGLGELLGRRHHRCRGRRLEVQVAVLVGELYFYVSLDKWMSGGIYSNFETGILHGIAIQLFPA